MKKFKLKFYSRKDIKPITIKDISTFIGVVSFIIIALILIISILRLSTSFFSVDDHVDYGRYISFHYIFLGIVGMVSLELSNLVKKGDFILLKNLTSFIQIYFYYLGATLFVISFFIALFHLLVSVTTTIYIVQYVITLLSY
jgi:predicted ferric reductase